MAWFGQAVGGPVEPSSFIREINRRMYNLVSKQNLGLASSHFWHISEVMVILVIPPKSQNPHIESSLTKNLGLASSQFLDILYPWIGSIKGHYRLVPPGRRGSCGTLVLNKRNQQANVQFGFKTKSRTCVIAVLTYIRGNGHINSLVSPLGTARP